MRNSRRPSPDRRGRPDVTARALQVAPWVALAVPAVIFPLALGAPGFVALAVWFAVIVAYRVVASALPPGVRPWVGVGAGFVCLAAGFEGGWYLLPSVALFVVADIRRRPEPTRRP